MNEKDNDAFNEKRSEYLDGINLPKDIAIKVKPPPPKYDYSKKESWAALPSGPVSYADLEPVDEPLLDNKDRPCDCFFVHPTGYFGFEYLNQPADDEQANERTRFMLAGQASAFSSRCRIYAPKYRQGSAALYYMGDKLIKPSDQMDVSKDNDSSKDPWSLAYDDVANAFRYYIQHYNNGRPFILASHSQGSGHMSRLLEEELEHNWKELKSNFIACYMIGARIPMKRIDEYKYLKMCQSPFESGVVIGWDTASVKAKPPSDGIKIIGTNPYTWRSGGDTNPISGSYNTGILNLKIKFNGPGGKPIENAENPMLGLAFGAVAEGIGKRFDPNILFNPNNGNNNKNKWTFTTQINSTTGELLIPDPPEHLPELKNWYHIFGAPIPGGSFPFGYHVCDYLYFWGNIRDNVIERVDRFVLNKKKKKSSKL